MSHEPQDRRYVDSRSKVGSMSFKEIRRFIGVDADVEGMEKESGTPTNPDGGLKNDSSSL